MISKSIKLAILMFCLLAICNCLRKETAMKDTYRMPLADNIQTLNPRTVRFRYDYQLIKTIFGQLISVNQDGYLAPQVSYRWEVGEDLQEYTLYLRKDVVFHDGKPLTSKDIVFSFEYEGKKPTLLHKALIPIEGYEEYYNGKSNFIKGIIALDDYTIKIRLNKPLATFLYTLANAKLVVLPYNFHSIPEEEFFKKPIGVGPYKFDYWNEKELGIIVNDVYFGNKGHIRKFVFTPMDKKKALEAFENHSIDDITVYPVELQEVKRKDINAFNWSSYNTNFLFFNVKKPPLENMYVRLAIRAAIDKRQLIAKCFSDDDVANGIVPRGMVGSIDDENLFKDLEKPVDYYLSKSGMSRKQLPKMVIIRFKEVEDSCFKPTIEEMFKKADLPITVEYFSFEDGVKLVESNNYYILSEWIASINIEPINIINFFDGRSTHNLSNVDDDEVNRLIDLVESARTRSARGEIYRKISEAVVRKAYVVDMQYENKHFIYDKAVRGIEDPSPVRFLISFNEIYFGDNL
jgi:ABC-type transport system substrate-binding protein